MKGIKFIRVIKRNVSMMLALILTFTSFAFSFPYIDAQANITVSSDRRSGSTVYMCVPETIYLGRISKWEVSEGGDGRYYAGEFSYFANNTFNKDKMEYSVDSNVKESTSGKFYFYCKDAVKLEIKLFDDAEATAVSPEAEFTFSNGSLIDGNNKTTSTKSVNVNLDNGYCYGTFSGFLNSRLCCETGESRTIKWQLTYYDSSNQPHTTYAYTTCYAILAGPSSTVAAEVFARRKIEWYELGKLRCIANSTVWVTGIHSITEGTTAHGNTSKGDASGGMIDPPLTDRDVTLISESGLKDDGVTEEQALRWTSGNEGYSGVKHNEKHEVSHIGGYEGNITVDNSRITNLNMVPWLKAGIDVHTAYIDKDASSNETKTSSVGIYSFGGTANNDKLVSTQTVKRDGSLEPRRSKEIEWSVGPNSTSDCIVIQGLCTARIAQSQTKIYLNVTYVNKEELRKAVQAAMELGLTGSENYRDAAETLGKPDASSSDVTNAIKKVSIRKVTENYHCTTRSGHDLSTYDNAKYYLYEDNITVTPSIPYGYHFDSSKYSVSNDTTENKFSAEEFLNTNPKIGGNNVDDIYSHGSNGIFFESGNNGTDNYSKNVDWTNQIYTIEVTPGQKYRFSYIVGGQDARVLYAFYNNDGNDIRSYHDIYTYGTNEAKSISEIITIPTGVKYVAFRFGNVAPNAMTSFDCITFEKYTGEVTSSEVSFNNETYNYTVNKCTYKSLYVDYYLSPDSYTVSYDGNGSTDGSMSESTFYYNENATLKSKEYTRGYSLTFNPNGNGQSPVVRTSESEFTGWKLEETDTSFINNATVNDNSLYNPTTKKATLYAQWTELKDVVVPQPKKKGCVFLGWYSEKEGGIQIFAPRVTSAKVTSTIAAYGTLYAHWEVATSFLVVNPNGGTFDSSLVVKPLSVLSYDSTDADDQIYVYHAQYNTKMELPLPEREGYTFIGWNRMVSNGSLENKTSSYTYSFGPENSTFASGIETEAQKVANVLDLETTFVDVIRAIWMENTYYITFNPGLSWGTGLVSNTKSYLYNSPVPTPEEPILTSFIFNGWDREIPEVMPAENLTISATWRDEPNAQYMSGNDALDTGYAVYLEGKDYSSLSKTDYIAPHGIVSDPKEITLNPFSSNKAQAVAFNVNMTNESNAYVFLHSVGGYAYAVITGTKLDENGKPLSKIIKITSEVGQYYDVTDLLEPGQEGTVSIRQSGIGDEINSYSYLAIGDIKLTTDKETSAQASLEKISEEDITNLLSLISIIPDDLDPIDVPEIIFEKLITKLNIVNYEKYNNKSVDYKTTITFSSKIENPATSKVVWYINGEKKTAAKDGSYTVKKATEDFTVYCTTKGNDGEVIKSEIETIRVNNGFFDRVVAVFRGWFNRLPVVVQ